MRTHYGRFLASAMVVALAGCAPAPGTRDMGAKTRPADQALSGFVGEWASIDYNAYLGGDTGSHQRMTIRRGEDGVVHIRAHADNSSAVCWEKRPGQNPRYVHYARTVTGVGRLEDPTTMVVPSLVVACVDGGAPKTEGPSRLEEAGTYKLVHDLATDRLYDNLGVVWNRGAPPENWAGSSTEDGVDGPGTFAMLHGEVTLRAVEPWVDHAEAYIDPRLFFLVGPGDEGAPGGETAYIEILVNPLPPDTPCDTLRVAPSAEELVQAIRSNPDLEASVPVTERIGGIDALRMDVIAASGASIAPCSDSVPVVSVPGRGAWGAVEPGDLGRLYVLDLPGGSARTLAILITAPEAALFERAIETAAPVLDSFEVHTDGSNEVGRPTATPTAQPAGQPSPPFTERFDSPLHGLSIGYPSGWRTRAATEPWGHDEVAFGAPGVDVIFHPTLQDDLYLAVVSEPLGGKSEPYWVQNLEPTSVGICKRATGAGGGGDTLHGHYGWFESCDTPFGRDSFGIFATATRGYIINLHIGEERAAVAAARRIGRLVPARYDGDWFWAALVETVDLRPKDALDALNPSESP